MTTSIDWDELFMMIAVDASMKSKDDNTHVGAVVVDPDNNFRTMGYNGMCRGVNDHIPERYIAPVKYGWFEHAERNAVFNSARFGGPPMKGCRMYITMCPCMECARAIIQSGINELIINKQFSDIYSDAKSKGGTPWVWEAEAMLSESGVSVRWYDRAIPQRYILLSGVKLVL